jgi:Tfp pilus assembly protein PilE
MTVLELMIVVSIIALLSVLAVPAIKALTRSNTISSANRQLLDDFALARQRAINERSDVYVVFVPTNVVDLPRPAKGLRNSAVLTNLLTGALTRYALYAERTAGDQPGQHHPRYLTGWHTLPEGIFIPPGELARLEKITINFPTVDGNPVAVPYIGFNQRGAVITNGVENLEGAYISLARGSVMYQRDDSHEVIFFDARENPVNNAIDNYNRVRITGLTGRARLERPEIQ